jgi:hypothetical protein
MKRSLIAYYFLRQRSAKTRVAHELQLKKVDPDQVTLKIDK